jgi:hypothetical protein
MPETYNPQERTFIKKPEQKLCITCGQPIAADIKPLTNHMNKYLNIISGNVVVMNSNENTVTVQGVTLYRVTGQDDKGKAVSSFVPAKTPAPTTPPPTNPAPKA